MLFNGTDATGNTQMHLFDIDPASATFGDLILTISDPDPFSPSDFGDRFFIQNNHLIVSDANASADTFYHVIDINRASSTFGDFVTTITDPDLTTSDEFGKFASNANDLFLVGDTDGSGNGLLHIFDANPVNTTFGEILKTVDFPAASSPDFIFLRIKDNLLFESGDSFFESEPIRIFDLDPQSPTFGQLLTTLEDPTPATSNMSGFPFFVENVALFSENAGSNFNMYAFDIDPDSPSFGQLLSTLTLPNPSGSWSLRLNENELVISFGDSVISLYHVSINPN